MIASLALTDSYACDLVSIMKKKFEVQQQEAAEAGAA